MGLADTGTNLVLVENGIPFYSARGLTQTLTLANAIKNNRQNIQRTVNGGLINLTPAQFNKYQTKITCTDQQSPSIDGVFPGMQITVWCIATLTYIAGGTPQRPVVTGSSVTANGFTTYRPILEMMVVDLQEDLDEWKGEIKWEMDLEEI